MQVGNVWDAVGHTPLIQIKSLSELTGCEIFAKAEFLNPGGSIKDRAAKGIIQRAEESGVLKPGGVIVEGTAGNTGIGLATLAAERGYRVIISIPETQSNEKFRILETLGAEVRKIGSYPFDDERHYYHQARKIAEETSGGFWANQFENTANYQIHETTTGPEIWQQMDGKIDILSLAAGTGGTISGASRFLKEQDDSIQVVLSDTQSSSLYGYVKNGELSGEGSSITEGIGISRLTANFKKAHIDDAMRVTDQQMLNMVYHIAKYDGLLIGTSSGVNLYGAYSLGMKHKNSGKRIVTFICDHGSRYQSRIFNNKWLASQGLKPGNSELPE